MDKFRQNQDPSKSLNQDEDIHTRLPRGFQNPLKKHQSEKSPWPLKANSAFQGGDKNQVEQPATRLSPPFDLFSKETEKENHPPLPQSMEIKMPAPPPKNSQSSGAVNFDKLAPHPINPSSSVELETMRETSLPQNEFERFLREKNESPVSLAPAQNISPEDRLRMNPPSPIHVSPSPKPRQINIDHSINIKPDEEGLYAVNIGKSYQRRSVLRSVSFHVKRGEAVGLLGPNGAGKTTSFYIISGLVGADSGQIILNGMDITRLPMYRRARLGIGYLPQEASIFRGLNVEDNIMAVLEVIEPNRDKRFEALESLLDEFSITHIRKSPSLALSGGERRRLEIARALASQPHYILLDEPLAGIDPIAVRDIRELVGHLKQRGIGVLITDHNVRDTLEVVDRAYILHDGHVLYEGTPDQIVNHEQVKKVYLGDLFQTK